MKLKAYRYDGSPTIYSATVRDMLGMAPHHREGQVLVIAETKAAAAALGRACDAGHDDPRDLRLAYGDELTVSALALADNTSTVFVTRRDYNSGSRVVQLRPGADPILIGTYAPIAGTHRWSLVPFPPADGQPFDLAVAEQHLAAAALGIDQPDAGDAQAHGQLALVTARRLLAEVKRLTRQGISK